MICGSLLQDQVEYGTPAASVLLVLGAELLRELTMFSFECKSCLGQKNKQTKPKPIKRNCPTGSSAFSWASVRGCNATYWWIWILAASSQLASFWGARGMELFAAGGSCTPGTLVALIIYKSSFSSLLSLFIPNENIFGRKAATLCCPVVPVTCKVRTKGEEALKHLLKGVARSIKKYAAKGAHLSHTCREWWIPGFLSPCKSIHIHRTVSSRQNQSQGIS